MQYENIANRKYSALVKSAINITMQAEFELVKLIKTQAVHVNWKVRRKKNKLHQAVICSSSFKWGNNDSACMPFCGMMTVGFVEDKQR